MEGYYEAHRATCQACSAVHLSQDSQPLQAAETIYVMDESPAGYEPDPRMMSRG